MHLILTSKSRRRLCSHKNEKGNVCNVGIMSKPSTDIQKSECKGSHTKLSKKKTLTRLATSFSIHATFGRRDEGILKQRPNGTRSATGSPTLLVGSPTFTWLTGNEWNKYCVNYRQVSSGSRALQFVVIHVSMAALQLVFNAVEMDCRNKLYFINVLQIKCSSYFSK